MRGAALRGAAVLRASASTCLRHAFVLGSSESVKLLPYNRFIRGFLLLEAPLLCVPPVCLSSRLLRMTAHGSSPDPRHDRNRQKLYGASDRDTCR